jgi:hypothetical protein
MDGVFFPTGPSVFKDRVEPWLWDNSNESLFTCGELSESSVTHARMYAMVSSGGEVIAFAARRVPAGNDAMGMIGILNTSDPEGHTVRETFGHFCKAANSGAQANGEIGFATQVYQFSYYGNCGSELNEMPLAAMGIFCTDAECPVTDSDARADPLTGEEWRIRLSMLRDVAMVYGDYSETDIDIEDALWACRANLQSWDTFDPVEGVGNGTTDNFAFAAGTVTLTDNEALFTPEMVGREITVAGATSAGNDGTFVVASYISATQITYANASGVSETLPVTCTWSVFEQYFHFEDGVCWKWPGFTAIA